MHSAHMSRCTYNAVVGATGAIAALVAPLIGCYIASGNNAHFSCIREGIERVACFEYNTMTISCILTVNTAGATFSAGICVFYSAYAGSMNRFILRVATQEPRLALCLKILLTFECIGVAMTALIPMISNTQSILHSIGFCIWITSGTTYPFIARCAHNTQREFEDPVSHDLVSHVLTSRAILALILVTFCFISGLSLQSTGPLFRISEYALLISTTTTGLVFVYHAPQDLASPCLAPISHCPQSQGTRAARRPFGIHI
jgi:hypothetical protein